MKTTRFAPSIDALCTVAVFGAALFGLIACSKPIACKQYDLTLCGTSPVAVTACGKATSSSDALQVSKVQLNVANPPAYLDVAPANAGSLPYFPPYVPLDSSLQVDPGGQELSSSGGSSSAPIKPRDIDTKVTPDVYGFHTGNYFEAVGAIQGFQGAVGTGVMVAPRVVLTAAHALLPAYDPKLAPDTQGYGVDLSKVVYKFATETDSLPVSNNASSQTVFNAQAGVQSDVGWAFIHPAFDPVTRANDVAIVVLQHGIQLSAGSYATLSAQEVPDLKCSCPLDPLDTMVVGYGEGGSSDNPTPPAVPKNMGNYNFPLSAGVQRNVAIAEIEAIDAFTDSDGLNAPSVDLLSSALYEGDKGAPVFLGSSSNITGYLSSLPLIAVYSSPSSIISRQGTRITQSVVDWIESTMLSTSAPYPPPDWNGVGDQSENSAYAFTPPAGWSATPQAGAKHFGPEGTGSGSGPAQVVFTSQFANCAPGPAASLLPTQINMSQVSRLIVIGDSLSDQQNQWNKLLSNQTPNPAAGYWNGRFTNGYNWVDYFTTDNNKPVINEAVGGAFASLLGQQVATASLTGPAEVSVRPTLATELTGISSGDQDQSIAVIWAGPNDVNEAVLSLVKQNKNLATFDPKPGVLAQNIVTAVVDAARTLYVNGASKILIGNIPQLDTTPQGTDPALGTEYYGQLGQAYARNVVNLANADIAAWVQEKNEQGWRDLTVVDIASFLNGWVTGTVTSVNMYQVTRACRNTDSANIMGLPGAIPIVGTNYLDEPCRGYLFFDPLHPTTLSHCGVSQLFESTMSNVLLVTGMSVGGGGDFESFCPRQVQNAPWTSTLPDARPISFYVPLPSGSAITTDCPTACPANYTWLNPELNKASEANVPSWFGIASIPGGTPVAGTTNGQMLAPGWTQNGFSPVEACLCQTE